MANNFTRIRIVDVESLVFYTPCLIPPLGIRSGMLSPDVILLRKGNMFVVYH